MTANQDEFSVLLQI